MKTELKYTDKKELAKARRQNAKLFPIYKMFSWDLLFFYSIEFLFYTITKKVTPSEVLIINGFYLLFRIVMQIPAVVITDFLGKRKSIILGNILLIFYIAILIFGPGAISIIIADLIFSLGYDIKTIAESNLLYDSVSTKGGDGLYSKLDARGGSWYYILDGIASLTAGYLFVMNMEIFQNFHIKVKRFSRVTYIRTVMPWVLKDYTDRYLYLDADMIAIGSLKNFLNINMDGKAIAAVACDLPDRVEFLKLKNGVYFQDGMLWIDIKNWIEQKVTERIFEYQGADPNRFKGQTQDIFNMVLDGDFKSIPSMFHHPDGHMDIEGILIHYSGRNKPWESVLKEDDQRWRDYLDISEWPSMPDPMPPKKPQYYHNYKKIAEICYDEHRYLKSLNAIFWYSVLKIRLKLGL